MYCGAVFPLSFSPSLAHSSQVLPCYAVEILTRTRHTTPLGICSSSCLWWLLTLRPVCTAHSHSCRFYELDQPDYTFPGLLHLQGDPAAALSLLSSQPQKRVPLLVSIVPFWSLMVGVCTETGFSCSSILGH